MKGAGDRCRRGVIDNREDLTDRERACPSRAEGKLGSAIDCYPVGNNFVRPSPFSIQLVNVGGIVVEGECALNGKCSWFLYSLARGQKGLHTGVSSNRHPAGNDPTPAKRAGVDFDV